MNWHLAVHLVKVRPAKLGFGFDPHPHPHPPDPCISNLEKRSNYLLAPVNS